MKSINDGGSAFPIQFNFSDGSVDTKQPGMSLRDWFAGQALVGLCAMSAEPTQLADGVCGGKNIAKAAVVLADALLAELISEQ